jgi:hypothetical protein
VRRIRNVSRSQAPEIVGDRRTAALEALGELEADLGGVSLVDLLDDPFEFVIPLPVVAEVQARVSEVALRILLVRSVLAHYPLFPPET